MIAHSDAEAASPPDGSTVIGGLYRAHYHALVRLARAQTGDPDTAEDLVQDVFTAIYAAWPRLQDPGNALPYLRRSVSNRSRSALRRRATAHAHRLPDAPGTDDTIIAWEQRAALLAALARLPARQRQAIGLRYYADLTESRTAAAMGISQGAVKSHTARGMATLRNILGY